MASEMLYPVMPVFLKEIGFSVLLIGILEGAAEAVAGLSKSYFGKWSDLSKRRLPFVQWGYTLSAISKPMMGLFSYPVWIFVARTIDRIGKGLRTGARDAMLSNETTKEHKAKVFGFHRSMDTLGAVIGPLAALLFLYYYPKQYKYLFFIAFVPGIMAILLTMLLKEKKPETNNKNRPSSFFSFIAYWNNSSSDYKKLVTALLIFTLLNSSDMFLLLQLKESGRTDAFIIGAYIFYNLVYALLAFPAGIIADNMGLKKTFIIGLMLFAITYAGFGYYTNGYMPFVLLFIYGAYAATTESIAKAWISNIVRKEETATAIGTYTGFQSICAMLASTIAGLIWLKAGASTMFLITALLTVLLVVYLGIFIRAERTT
jgi:MFS family permease